MSTTPRHLATTFAVALALLSGTDAYASGPTEADFPFSKQWKGKHYGKTIPWWSAGLVVGSKRARISPWAPNRSHLVFGLEGRHHLGARSAIVLGAQFAGHRLENSGDYTLEGDAGDLEVPFEATFEYREGLWFVGADWSLLEAKSFHIQVGPRIGLQLMSAETVADASGGGTDSGTEVKVDDHVGTGSVKSQDPYGGAAVRIGAFPIPWVEIGVHIQSDVVYGTGNADRVGYSPGLYTGMGFGAYSVVHF